MNIFQSWGSMWVQHPICTTVIIVASLLFGSNVTAMFNKMYTDTLLLIYNLRKIR